MTIETRYPHIVHDERGAAVIEGTSLKVSELVVERLAYLTLGQIYSALAYYSDHAEAMDREIAERLDKVEASRQQAQQEPSPLRARLRGQRPH